MKMIKSKLWMKEKKPSCIKNGKKCNYLRKGGTYCSCEDEMCAMCIPEYDNIKFYEADN